MRRMLDGEMATILITNSVGTWLNRSKRRREIDRRP
jgi:hypothetical protein